MQRTLVTLVSALFLLSLFAVPASADASRFAAGHADRALTEPPPKEKDKDRQDDQDKDKGNSDKEQPKAPPKDKEEPKKKDEPAEKDKGKEKAKEQAKTEDQEKGGDKAKPEAKTKPSPIKKLVEIKLDQYLIPARALNIPLPGRTQTIRELMERFEKFGKDDEVGAVLLDLQGLELGLPDIEQLRDGVAELRKTERKVFAYLNSGDPMDYLLACQADEIAMAPTASLAIPGLGRVFPFMRGMYQLQGIEFDVITAGRFKYPGFNNQREPNKYFVEEFGSILDDWYGDYVRFIAEGRKLTPEKVKGLVDIALFNAEDAKNRGLVDTLAYYEDYRDRVLRRHKFEKSKGLGSEFAKATSLNDLLNLWQKQIAEAQQSYTAVGPKIAVLHARGPIIDQDMGAGFSSQMIMRDQFVQSIDQIRKNKTIRGVVLYIDSPGGSGYASDVIWQKLRELNEEKPLVVSMGTVAGSGGYYIACPARLIFAQPTTITGSIGVIALLQNQASKLSRSDINVYPMERGARSLLGAGFRDMKSEDRDFLQKHILDFYEIFLDRVAVTRKMPKDEVRKLAEGRIYTGRQAQKVGLVDRLGGLNDAIAAVREMADIPRSAEIKLIHYPKPATIGELVENLAGLSGGVSQMLGQVVEAQSAAPCVSFEAQLRYFGQAPKPLCWMPLPDVRELLNAGGPPQIIRDLLPQAPAMPLP